MFSAYLKSDFLKTRRLSVVKAHLLIPVAVAALFLVYYAWAPWGSLEKINIFYQVLGMGLPFLISLFCSMLAEQEQAAGSFQNMLAAPGRRLPFLAKLLLLLLFGLGAVLLASGIFGIVFLAGYEETVVGADFYLIVSAVLWGSSIPLYVFHLFLALKFNRGISLGLGIVESLIAAVFLTGLGDVLWKYVPPSWPARMPAVLLQMYRGEIDAGAELSGVFPVYLAVMTAAFGLFVIWSGRWEGIKNAD